MYATEQTYVIAYLAISFGFVQGCTGLRTIRTSINCAYYRRSQLGGGMPVRGAPNLESWHRLVQTIEQLDCQVEKNI